MKYTPCLFFGVLSPGQFQVTYTPTNKPKTFIYVLLKDELIAYAGIWATT